MHTLTPLPDLSRFTSPGHHVQAGWIDAYGHMNMARYVEVFDSVCYQLLDLAHLGLDYSRRSAHGLFVVDARTRFLRELRAGASFAVDLRIVDVDDIRLHTWLQMRDAQGGRPYATHEQIALHASLHTRRAVGFDERTMPWLRSLAASHRADLGGAGDDALTLSLELP